jgi:hypothetical protein
MPDSEPVEALSFSAMLRQVLSLAEARSFEARNSAQAPAVAGADDAAEVAVASRETPHWRATIASRA